MNREDEDARELHELKKAHALLKADEDANELEDLKRAYALLGGISKQDKNGLPKREYMKAKSAEEAEARKSLARLLRSQKPLDSLIRMLLASLFDPEPYSYFTKGLTELPEPQTEYSARQITFVKPGRRNREDEKRLKLAFEVGELVKNGVKVDAALAEIATKFKAKYPTVKQAWLHYKNSNWIKF